MVQSPKNTNVSAMFDRLAPEYDRMNNIISLGTHRHWRRKVMQKIHFSQRDDILDVATGTADWALALAASSSRQSRVEGLDFSAEMLTVGQQKINASSYKNKIQLMQGDAMALPYEDNQFDIVTIGFGLRNLPDPKRGLAEIYRVLKTGGQLVILETSQPQNRFIKPFWQLYIRKIVPNFGRVFANGKHQEYRYLDETTEAFMDFKALDHLLAQVGFIERKTFSFNLGAARAYYGIKD